MSRLIFVLLLVTLELVPQREVSGQVVGDSPDVLLLTKTGISLDSSTLIDFFLQRTVTKGRHQEAAHLVRELGDMSFKIRDKAAVSLRKLGLSAEHALQEAVRSPDAEVQRRARACLDHIAKLPRSRSVVTAAIRVLVRN